MHSWRKLCTIASVFLLAVILLLSWFGSPLIDYQMEQKMYTQLQKQGYQREDILKLDTIYDRHGRTPYLVQVIFADAPETVHSYFYDGEQVLQEMEQTEKTTENPG
jgi:hypothetical protein